MAAASITAVCTDLQALFDHGVVGSLTDGQLLERFLQGEDALAEAAFAALVRRHGAMVSRVCRSALGDEHDAEDASQAVFLVLARRAGSVCRYESAASWLYGVARRVAARARRDAARRRKHERRRAEMAEQSEEGTSTSVPWEELYQEIDRLPEVYRAAVVLCHLEGLSHEQSAGRLGCPLRTFQSRLLRARARLRQRLTRPGASLAAVIPPPANPVSPPVAWLETTSRAARAFAAGRAGTAGSLAASPAAVAMAESALRTMILVPLMTAAAVLGTAAVTALVVVLARGWFAAGPAPGHLNESTPPAVAQKKNDPENRTLEIRVVDRQSRPIEGVEVSVETDSGARAGLGGELELMTRQGTDKEGRCRIEFPRVLPKEIYIKAHKPGYADRSYAPSLETGAAAIPSNHTIELESGTSIGGIVKRRDGRPISGATVEIMARAGADDSPDYSYIHDTSVTTDAQGRWTFSAMPSGWSRVYVSVAHPDFVATVMQRDVPIPSDLDLKARKAEAILDEGVSVLGRVIDDRGRPIVGATVALGADRRIRERGFPSVATDAEGRFRFDHLPPGTQTLTAQAPGRAPELADVVVAPDLKPVEFRLVPGHNISGRVVDRDGKPLEGVTVQAMDWKGHMSLDWTTKTNAEGRFTWDSAPGEPVLLTLTKPGYVMVGQREFHAGKGETQATMYPPLRIRGKVLDARSGQPVPQLTVVIGAYYRFSNPDGHFNQVNWDRRGTWRVPAPGQYETEYSLSTVAAVAVRIEAEGYKPATSEPFKMEAGDVTFDAKLEPGSGPSGVVHGSDGRALAGATVVLSTRSLRAQLFDGKFHETGYPQVVTGADGRFGFPAQTEPFRVFVYHDRGFAEADEKALARSPMLTIHAWGRIEGTVKIGSRTAGGVVVSLAENAGRWAPEEAMPITQGQQLTADIRGNFTFEHVMPGELSVSRFFTLERLRGSVGTGDSRSVTVEPGKTTWVDLGGTGRPVVGRFVLPSGIKPSAIFARVNQTLELIRPEPPWPKGLSRQGREPWLAEWLATEPGKAYARSSRACDTNVRPDGRFRVEDVSAGKYRIYGEVREPGQGSRSNYGPELASIIKEIIVPEIPGGRSDEPLDLGTIELTPTKPRTTEADYAALLLKPGTPAPEFEVKTVDGKALKLADYRGKFVLLDFWATWCGPCIGETPYLKSTNDAFGKDDRLVMIGLSLDKLPADPKEYAESNGLNWLQGFLGDWSNAKLPEDYGVQAIPAIFLIGPDGKVLRAGLHGEAIKSAVAEALGKPVPQ